MKKIGAIKGKTSARPIGGALAMISIPRKFAGLILVYSHRVARTGCDISIVAKACVGSMQVGR